MKKEKLICRLLTNYNQIIKSTKQHFNLTMVRFTKIVKKVMIAIGTCEIVVSVGTHNSVTHVGNVP